MHLAIFQLTLAAQFVPGACRSNSGLFTQNHGSYLASRTARGGRWMVIRCLVGTTILVFGGNPMCSKIIFRNDLVIQLRRLICVVDTIVISTGSVFPSSTFGHLDIWT
nr:hypothetical protein CFP56_37255 [Quercus suber]